MRLAVREQDHADHNERRDDVRCPPERPVQRYTAGPNGERLRYEQQHPRRGRHRVEMRIAGGARDSREIRRPEGDDGHEEQSGEIRCASKERERLSAFSWRRGLRNDR